MTELKYHTLKNGIRVVHKPVDNNVAHLGIIINTGSRDEEPEEHGMAHLLEHVIFKGTQKRKSYHVISRMEDVGGEMDAYTTKEETVIYSAFLNEYYKRAIELFADILFNSTFPEREIEKEKDVIIDEINSYKDSPGELIFDDFEEMVFSNHSIGRNILGTPDALKLIKREDLLRFIANNYNTDQMVICSVGKVNYNSMIKWIEQYFGNQIENKRIKKRVPVYGCYVKNLSLEKDTYQTHCIIGNKAYSVNDKKRLPLELLINILGGPGMNSRLNMALREKHGYTYNIESFYTSYSDTGIAGIYFGTDSEKVERSLSIIHKEIKKLQDKHLGILQLERAKRQLIGQIAISSESNSSLMLSIGKSYLLFDRVDSIDTVYKKINSIKAEYLIEVANEIFRKDDMSSILYY